MLLAVAYASLLAQQLGPVLPPSCSPAFQTTVLSIEDALQQQEFAKAKARLWLLPKKQITIEWDESKVPVSFRAEFESSRDEAIAIWKAKVPDFKAEIKPKGDVRISFEPVLAKRPDGALPASHVGFFGEDPTRPRLDFVIGLKRGHPLQQTQATDVFDDVAYAIGMYFGIADGEYDTYTMGRTDMPRIAKTTVSGTELNTVKKNFFAIQALIDETQKQVPIIAAKSDLFVDPTVVEGPPSLQGDHVELRFQITNKGAGPLTYSMFPDCGCTIVSDPGQLDSGSSKLLDVAVDTSLFTSDIVKHVTLYTNDPINPVRVITLKIPIKRRYRLIIPDGSTVVVPKEGRKYVVYLIPTSGVDLDPVGTRFDGMPATVTSSTFNGMLADPEANEGPMMRKGYKYIINLKGGLPSGRSVGSLQILTSNSEIPDIAITVYAYNGITALPDEVRMGHIGHHPKSVTFEIIGPGVEFKVLGVTTNSPNLKAQASPIAGSSGYKVVVQYDGKGPSGDFIGNVRVKTSNSKQPIIDVPIRADIQ